MSKLKLFLKKTLLASIVAIGIFGGNQVFAGIGDAETVNNPPTSITSTTKCRTIGDKTEECRLEKEKALNERASLLDDILRAMYLLLWPLIYLAGLAIDNGLVFGESIGLDLYLRKFWTMMVVIAYMGLGVSLLMTVYEGVQKGGDELIKLLKGQAKKTALAAILIPLSRFIVQQLVSLSTLLVFTVGALPLNVNMSGTTDCTLKANHNNTLCSTVLQMHTRFNLTDMFGGDRTSLALYSTRETDTDEVDKVYVQCLIVNNKIDIDAFSKKIEDIKDLKNTANEGLRKIGQEMIFSKGKALGNDFTNKLTSDYCVIKANTLFETKGKSGKYIDLFSEDYKKGITDANTELKNKKIIKIHSILEASKSAIGPLTAIYGSILDFGSITTSVSNNQGSMGSFIEAIMKGFQGIMLFIPLVGFVVVMMVRVGYLWVVIGFSPLIVLFNTVFKESDAAKKVKDIKFFGNLGDTLNRIELAKLIMQPAIVMFALSIGLILLSIIDQTLKLDQGALDYFNFGVTSESNNLSNSCFNLLGLQTICIEGGGLGYGVSLLSDVFNRGILNIIGIMVVWAIFFAALKSNKITQKVAENVQEIANNYVGTREIIPYGDKKVGFMAAKSGVENIRSEITKVDGSEQYKKIVEPENKRIASGVAGDRSRMNGSISESVKGIKDDNDTSTLKSVVSDKNMLGNEYLTLSDVDSSTKFKGQNARDALTELGSQKGSIYASELSYKEVKEVLNKKNYTSGRSDAAKYEQTMTTKVQEMLNNKSLISSTKEGKGYFLTKNRNNEDTLIEVLYEFDKNKKLKIIDLKLDEKSKPLLNSKTQDIKLETLNGFVDSYNGLGLAKQEGDKLYSTIKSINNGTPIIGNEYTIQIQDPNNPSTTVSQKYKINQETDGKLKVIKIP